MDDRVAKAYDFIKRNYEKRINLEMISAYANLSPFHLQRIFKEEMGESPHECLSRLRLEKAAHLMKINPSKSLTVLAFDCGFSSLATFSRAFKNAFGLSPSEFRSSPDAPMASQEAIDALTPLDVHIEYVPEYWIYYRHTSIYTPDLSDQFEIARTFCESKGIISSQLKKLGAFSHIPIHDRHEHLNYFAGVQIEASAKDKLSNTFRIPEGTYACFYTEVPYEQIAPLLMKFKQEWLDIKPYYIQTIFTFEEWLTDISPSTPNGIPRKVYIPVESK